MSSPAAGAAIGWWPTRRPANRRLVKTGYRCAWSSMPCPCWSAAPASRTISITGFGELRRAAGPRRIGTFPALAEFGPSQHERSVAAGWRTVSGLAALALSNYTPLPVLDWLTRGPTIFHCLDAHAPSAAPAAPHRHHPRHDLLARCRNCTPPPTCGPSAGFADVLRRADRLIAISESTRRDAVRVLRLPAEKIVVIHPGIAESFFHVDALPSRRCGRAMG